MKQVQGVVTLGLGGIRIRQFLDCNKTQTDVSNLQWRKDNAETRFDVQFTSNSIRLNLSTARYSDEGIYECIDTVTQEIVSVNVTGGKMKYSSHSMVFTLYIVCCYEYLVEV